MQGFNMGRYVPPDQEGRTTGNRLLGVRANKATAAGVPVVRFEMPFAVWCDGCEAQTQKRSADGARHPVLIGQGVRFNAEKHRAGAYYTTPIWLFRMRHPACGTWIEIRTDPATTSYVVASGGRRRREYDDEDASHDDPAARAAAAAAALAGLPEAPDAARGAGDDRASAFDRLERTIAHRAAVDLAASAASAAALRLDGLAIDSARHWQDPYARNRALRAAFRSGRHARERDAAADDDLRRRLGGLDPERLPTLLPATEEDARRAALVDFGGRAGGAADSTLEKPLFSASPPTTTTTTPRIHKTDTDAHTHSTAAEKRRRVVRDHLAATVATNTRRSLDPFLDGSWEGRTASTHAARLPGVKRKRMTDEGPGPPAATVDRGQTAKSVVALVSYDSD